MTAGNLKTIFSGMNSIRSSCIRSCLVMTGCASNISIAADLLLPEKNLTQADRRFTVANERVEVFGFGRAEV